MAGYTPLFSSIVTSSIWNEENATRIVWITMLALADANGIVEGSVPGLAHVARVKIEDCEKALIVLLNPDKYSRTKENEGRRIHAVEGGWQIYNFAKFRRRAQHGAAYYQEYRKKKKISDSLEEKSKQPQTTPNKRNHAQPFEGCAFYNMQQVKDACIVSGIPEINAKSYFDQYVSQGWKKANGQTITNLRSHMAKRWNRARNCWDFDEKKAQTKKTAAETAAELKAKGLME